MNKKIYKRLFVWLLAITLIAAAFSVFYVQEKLHIYEKHRNGKPGTYVCLADNSTGFDGYVKHEITLKSSGNSATDRITYYKYSNPEIAVDVGGMPGAEEWMTLKYFKNTEDKILYLAGDNAAAVSDTYIIVGEGGTFQIHNRISSDASSYKTSEEMLYYAPTPDSPTTLYPIDSEIGQRIVNGEYKR